MHRSDQVSFGDGNKYEVKPTRVIPILFSNSYENYVVAANDNVIHTKVSESEVKGLIKLGSLKEYHEMYTGKEGESLLNRFIDTTGPAKNTNYLLVYLNHQS